MNYMLIRVRPSLLWHRFSFEQNKESESAKSTHRSLPLIDVIYISKDQVGLGKKKRYLPRINLVVLDSPRVDLKRDQLEGTME